MAYDENAVSPRESLAIPIAQPSNLSHFGLEDPFSISARANMTSNMVFLIVILGHFCDVSEKHDQGRVAIYAARECDGVQASEQRVSRMVLRADNLLDQSPLRSRQEG